MQEQPGQAGSGLRTEIYPHTSQLDRPGRRCYTGTQQDAGQRTAKTGDRSKRRRDPSHGRDDDPAIRNSGEPSHRGYKQAGLDRHGAD